MTKIIFLLPPSEGKNTGGKYTAEKLSFNFKKPITIAKNATEKDLKCKDKRYEEGIALNKKCVKKITHTSSPRGEEDYIEVIHRYSGVMYNAIGYESMFESGKKYFEENIFILSGMYGIVKPLDIIGNYKLPIETKGLLQFWGDTITHSINEMKPDYVINLLPLSYQKMIHFSELDAEIIDVNFYTKKDGELKKMTHGVKKVKGEWLKGICESGEKNYHNFGGVVVTHGKNIEVQIIKK